MTPKKTTPRKKRVAYRTSSACMSLLVLLLFVTCCGQSPAAAVGSTRSPSRGPLASYTSRVVERGGFPDDLAFNPSGQLLFTSEVKGTISRLNADGSVTVLLHDASAPEGLVVLSDGTMIFAEQSTNQIVALAPGTTTPKVLRVLAGSRHHTGVDGIALDLTTNTLIVPDSPTGDMYRMSLDGQTLTLLASGLSRPVGAGVDRMGNIYIADENGGAIWTITPGGKITRMGGFGEPDDVVSTGPTTLLVIDLATSVHTLIQLDLKTGNRTILARQGLREPQGLIVDPHGNIFVADDEANLIEEFLPV